VSACDLTDVYKVTTIARPGVFVVLNRDIFISDSFVLKRYRLSDAGLLEKTSELTLDWKPSSISVASSLNLLAGDSTHVVSVLLSSFPSSPVEWETDRPLNLDSIVRTSSGEILAPAGVNGVDRFAP
jgi:hypothetical protein